MSSFWPFAASKEKFIPIHDLKKITAEALEEEIKAHPDRLNERSDKGDTPLICACRDSNDEAVFFLLKNHADTNAKNNDAITALWWACFHCNCQVTAALVEHGAEVDARNNHGVTALRWACAMGHHDLAMVLIRHSADVHAMNKGGGTTLMGAAAKGLTDLCLSLLDHGVQINASDEGGLTALMVACEHGHTDCADMLMEHGADVNAATRADVTVLMKACSGGTSKMVIKLIERGADLNAVDHNGCSPLMRACGKLRSNIAELLIQLGADLTIKNVNGKTALDYLPGDDETLLQRLLFVAKARSNWEASERVKRAGDPEDLEGRSSFTAESPASAALAGPPTTLASQHSIDNYTDISALKTFFTHAGVGRKKSTLLATSLVEDHLVESISKLSLLHRKLKLVDLLFGVETVDEEDVDMIVAALPK